MVFASSSDYKMSKRCTIVQQLSKRSVSVRVYVLVCCGEGEGTVIWLIGADEAAIMVPTRVKTDHKLLVCL